MTPRGRRPRAQAAARGGRLPPMLAEQSRCLVQELLPQLAERGVVIASYNSLSADERTALQDYFEDQVFPVLTPQAVDPSHPFPYISNLSLNLALMVAPLPEHGITSSLVGKIEPRFARIKVPPLVPRLIPIEKDGSKFILLEDLIAANANALVPGARARPNSHRKRRVAVHPARRPDRGQRERAVSAHARQRVPRLPRHARRR